MSRKAAQKPAKESEKLFHQARSDTAILLHPKTYNRLPWHIGFLFQLMLNQTKQLKEIFHVGAEELTQSKLNAVIEKFYDLNSYFSSFNPTAEKIDAQDAKISTKVQKSSSPIVYTPLRMLLATYKLIFLQQQCVRFPDTFPILQSEAAKLIEEIDTFLGNVKNKVVEIKSDSKIRNKYNNETLPIFLGMRHAIFAFKEKAVSKALFEEKVLSHERHALERLQSDAVDSDSSNSAAPPRANL